LASFRQNREFSGERRNSIEERAQQFWESIPSTDSLAVWKAPRAGATPSFATIKPLGSLGTSPD